ncbi:hypothetical protein GGQ85_000736 [Nitrobacter vulgaris]|uniref:hypothetical protein n=1 Tax=Nitrobacter vulgaris TaxID=29421 RepID=UPI0028615EC7|nr:hypothetical protein [Nitrobacter vulgaris]MDR6303055.1 hypothetical protein [Nitrobacter vulgaris]
MLSDKPTVFNFDVDSGRIMRAMYTEDDIGAVIRIHFEIDRALDHIVRTMVPSSNTMKLPYTSSKVDFLLALGLPNLRITPVLIINSIRNKFAHREKEAIVLSDTVDLLRAIETMYDRKIPESFQVIHQKKDGSRCEWRFGEMSPKEKFCFLGSLALAGVAMIESDFEKVSFKSLMRRP